ncbi:MAG: hypothetical protein DCF19_18160, partial [Pseudanabaena frigida]
MLRSTLRQMASISGRSFLAIGLTMGAMAAWSSAAKADVIYVNNPAVETVTFTQDAQGQVGTAIPLSSSTGLSSTVIGSLNLKSNSVNGYTINAISANNGTLNKGVGVGVPTIAYTMQFPALTPFNGAIASGAGTAIDDVSALNVTAASAAGLDRNVSIAVAPSEVTG